MENTADSGYVITGFTYSFGNNYSAFLIKTDSLGNVILSKKFGGSGHEFGDLIKPALDGGFLITGKVMSAGSSDFDVYLAKIDSVGSIGCYASNASFISTTVSTQITTPLPSVSTLSMNVSAASFVSDSGCTVITLCLGTGISENYSNKNSISVFPNPVKDIVIVEGIKGIIKVMVTDILGRPVPMRTLDITEGLGKIQLDLSNVSKGIYMLNVNSAYKAERIKIVVE